MSVKYLLSLAVSLAVIQFFYKNIEQFQAQQNNIFPINTVPVRYELWIKTDIDKGVFDFSGRVKIHVKVLEATKSVTIHYRQIEVTEINLIHRNVTSSLAYSFEQQKEFLHITLPNVAVANETFIIEIAYGGILRDDLLGFYRSSYTDSNNETVWLAATLFEATYARSAFPCYDEPSIRAAISLEIQHDESYHSISNMPVVARNHINGTSYVITKFLDTPPMQTYLLAFVVSNLKHVQSNDVNVPQRIYARPAAIDNGELDVVVQKLDDILRLLEDHFQIPFPMPKLDHVALPGHSTLAMENYGLICYQQSKLLVNNDTTQETIDQNFMVVFHEFTHQYFGDLVSIKSWDDLWIIEGIASLYETQFMSLLFPDRAKEFSDYFVLSTVYVAHAIDTDDNDNDDKVWPLNRHVKTSEEIKKKFNLASYKKAAAVLRNFQEAMGHETWLKGLRLFLKEMKFKSANASDLHHALQTAYDDDHPGSNIVLGAMMETWESQPGFPMLTVMKYDGKLILTQERYPEGNGEVYAIPINYATASNPDFENKTAAVWMTEQQMEIEYDDDWIVFNIQNTGYYFVNYDEDLWSDITFQLLRNHSSIHYMNRILLLLNHMRAARKGFVSMSGVLKMFDYMKFERDATVWNEADDIIFTLDKAFSEFWFYKDFKDFVRNIVEMNYHLNRSLAVTDWACKTGLEACTKDALAKLELLIKTNDSTATQQDYCHGIGAANETTFNHFWKLLLSSDDENLKLKLIIGLACSLNEDLLREYLQSSINNTFRYTNEDRLNIIEAMIEHTKGLHLAFDFVLENYETIYQISGDGLSETFIPAIAANLNLKTDFEELRKFESLIIAKGLATSSYKSNIDFYLKLNTDWQKHSFEEVEEFFRQMNHDSLFSAAPSVIDLIKNFWKINIIGFLTRVIHQM